MMEEQLLVDVILPHVRMPDSGPPTFLEVGGLDGLYMSNTLYLESCRGWHGLLIEGHPKNFGQLVRNRPAATAVHSALCETYGNVAYTAFANEGSGLHLFVRNISAPIYVPCAPLQHYLEMLNLRHLSLLSVDVEGAELQVLRSVRWDRTSVAILIVEERHFFNNTLEERKNDAVHDVLSLAGMQRVWAPCWGAKPRPGARTNHLCNAYYAHPQWVRIDELRQSIDAATSADTRMSEKLRSPSRTAAQLRCGTPSDSRRHRQARERAYSRPPGKRRSRVYKE